MDSSDIVLIGLGKKLEEDELDAEGQAVGVLRKLAEAEFEVDAVDVSE